MSQFLHLLSHTGVGLPTDLWSPYKKHPSTKLMAGGKWHCKRFYTKRLKFVIGGYYKKSDNIIGYKEGASF